MKQRLITAGIGLILFFVILFCYETIFFDIAVCAISLIAAHELLLAVKATKNIPLTIAAMLMGVVPFLYLVTKDRNLAPQLLDTIMPGCYMAAVAVMFLILLRFHETLSFEKVAAAFFIAQVIPFALSTLIQLRNEVGTIQGLYYTLLIFACAWGADSGAYFAGRFFGKRKLSPKISPNKTIEGVYGGVASCILFVAGLTALYYAYERSIGVTVEIHWLSLLLISLVGSLVGVLGDLTASVIKRQTGIKDFGSIMPGHGGVLDRFDSVLFVAPVLFVLFQILPV